MRLLCFGDSITQGFWDSNGGWVARIRQRYDEDFMNSPNTDYVGVFNLGIDGDTTKSILLRVDSEIASRKWQRGKYAFIIATGTNDTIYTKTKFQCEPAEYVAQLEKIVEVCKKYSNLIYFVGLTPVDDKKLNPMPWSKSGKSYSTERMSLFNDVLKAFCEKNKIGYVSIWDEFTKNSLDKCMYDGVHPNDFGHEIIAKKVYETVTKKVRV